METKVFVEKLLKDQEIHPVVIQDGKCQTVIELNEDRLRVEIEHISGTGKHLLRLRMGRRKKDADYLYKHTEVGPKVSELEYEKRRLKSRFWEQACEICAKYW